MPADRAHVDDRAARPLRSSAGRPPVRPANWPSTVAWNTFAKSASDSSTEGASTVVLVRLCKTSRRPWRATTSATARRARRPQRVHLDAPAFAAALRARGGCSLARARVDVGDDTWPRPRRVGERVAAPIPPPPPTSTQTFSLRAPTAASVTAGPRAARHHGPAAIASPPAQPKRRQGHRHEQDHAVGDVDRGLAERKQVQVRRDQGEDDRARDRPDVVALAAKDRGAADGDRDRGGKR